MRTREGRKAAVPALGTVGQVASFFVIVSILAAGCTSPQGAAPGDTVRVTYSMAFPGGVAFESNQNGSPLEFVLGSGTMIQGFDQAIVGMVPGETKTVIIPPERGYGLRDEKLVGKVNTTVLEIILSNLEKNGTFTQVTIPGVEGTVFMYRLPDNRVFYYTFTNITPDTTTVDQNNPLAGRELQVTITLNEIIRKK
ncbi:MAG: FKBP-type peptidyl-prolyl cis-trans isomerase [Methanolinea sp.]|nr:FKBP-type peptidyl-prolyl cis-trans isomerase [Methanolinea sp.]